MLSTQQLSECLTRLGTLKFFPVREAVVSEIGRMFNELCRNDGEAKRLVDSVLSEFSEWPGPAKLREVYRAEVASQRAPEEKPQGCSLCIDGFQSVYEIHERMPDHSIQKRIVYPEPGEILNATKLERRLNDPDARVYTAAIYCTCPLGRMLREAARNRKAQRGNGA